MSVCGCVRALGVVVPLPPRLFTSLYSCVYFLLVSAYGPFVRNCDVRLSVNGFTFPTQAEASRTAFGTPHVSGTVVGGLVAVGRHSPGLSPHRDGTVAKRPSP